jgi:diguanylate cyclase (GGDEF)-like protein
MTSKDNRPKQAAELRRQAEAKLSERQKKAAAPPMAESDTQRMVHELEVHQIELEMQNIELETQNEELLQSCAQVEAGLRLYTDLYDFAPVGYLSLARDGAIHKINLAGANLLGVERTAPIKRRFGLFVSVESLPIFNAFLEKVFESRKKESCEIALLKDGHETRWAQIEGTISLTSNGDVQSECRAVVSDITVRKRVEEKLQYLGTHDALTGVYNRAYFEEEFDRLKRGRGFFPVSVVMVDVDGMKAINDSLGHAAGDALLQAAAVVLASAFRSEDVVARIGGDEFAVLLPASDRATAEKVVTRVRKALSMQNSNVRDRFLLSLSIGMASGEKGCSLSEVLREADENMYREKELKKGNKVKA